MKEIIKKYLKIPAKKAFPILSVSYAGTPVLDGLPENILTAQVERLAKEGVETVQVSYLLDGKLHTGVIPVKLLAGEIPQQERYFLVFAERAASCIRLASMHQLKDALTQISKVQGAIYGISSISFSEYQAWVEEKG